MQDEKRPSTQRFGGSRGGNSKCADRNEGGILGEVKQPGESAAKGLRQEGRRRRRQVSPSAWATVRTWDFYPEVLGSKKWKDQV